MDDLTRIKQVGEAIQVARNPHLAALGRLLAGNGTVADCNEWPGLASDLGLVAASSSEAVPVPLYVMEWEEVEPGWGCRPDGYSVSLSPADYATQVKEFNERNPRAGAEEFERPWSTQLTVIAVPPDSPLLAEVKEGRWRFYRHDSCFAELRAALDALRDNFVTPYPGA